MLKLKIGKNFLITPVKNTEIKNCITYMMGCFKGENQIAVNACMEHSINNINDLSKTIQETRATTIYFLYYLDILKIKKDSNNHIVKNLIWEMKLSLKDFILAIKQKNPALDIKVINVNAYERSPEFKLAGILYSKLQNDNTSILSVISNLEQYKYFSKRYAAIPNELKVIDNDLKNLSKAKAVCDRVVTTETIKYLKLVKEAKTSGSNLELVLNELRINPSEELGLVFDEYCFKENPYLFNAAKYIYLGGHFKMVPTRITVDGNFKLHFIETIDHRFDKMLSIHNWSHVGYPHFGNGGFCAGEFNDTMAHAKEYGLDYYFISLKQYLTTANMRDTAGYRVWWYPIYNEQEEMIYCAGIDILINEYIKYSNPELFENLQTKTWEEKATLLKDCSYNYSQISRYGGTGYSYYHKGPDAFLAVCQELDKDLYNKIMEGRKN